jgi:hypothetical protein
MGFEFLVASGDSLVQIAAANGEMAVVIYALRYFWRAGGICSRREEGVGMPSDSGARRL